MSAPGTVGQSLPPDIGPCRTARQEVTPGGLAAARSGPGGPQAPVASASSPSATWSAEVDVEDSSALARRAMMAAEAEPKTARAATAIQGLLNRSPSSRSRE